MSQLPYTTRLATLRRAIRVALRKASQAEEFSPLRSQLDEATAQRVYEILTAQLRTALLCTDDTPQQTVTIAIGARHRNIPIIGTVDAHGVVQWDSES